MLFLPIFFLSFAMATMTSTDDMYMRRCFQLARHGLGHTRPNPLVGCVVVCDGRVVSEGFHQCHGQWHAERNAILNCAQPHLLQGATLYVNLEPCAHQGHTPPCAPLVAESGIRRVVVSCDDPNPRVDGRGYDILRQAGIEVVRGVLQEEGSFLNRRFFTLIEQKRPYIILKWAQTEDGYMDVDRSDGMPHNYWITGTQAKHLSHRWRTEEAAILVGSQTYLNDRPQLTPRLYAGAVPQRFVMDRRGRLSSVDSPSASAQETLPSGWTLLRHATIAQAMQALGEQQVQSLIVEGGRELLDAFLDAGLYDEIRCLVAPRLFGRGLSAPALPTATDDLALHTTQVGDDKLLTLYRSYRPAYDNTI